MNIYCNPQLPLNNASPTNPPQDRSSHHRTPKQKSNSIQNMNQNHLSIPKSLAKFKRTNPNLQNTNTLPPNPQKHSHQSILNSETNDLKHPQTPYNNQLNCQGYQKNYLTTSRSTTKKQQSTNFLYVSPSKEHKILLTQRNSPTRDKYHSQNQEIKSVKSLKSGKSSSKGSKAQHQKYSLYWKMKAHEYLQNNFKLSEQISQLKRKLGKYQISLPTEGSITNSEFTFSEVQSQNTTQKSIPVYIVQLQQKNYLQQISQLQISNRLKGSVIENMQNKIIELTQQIKGQHQKSQLLQRMRRQIAELQERNRKLSIERYQDYQVIKQNKIYQTQKTLQKAKEQSKPPIQIEYAELPQYKFQKDLQKNRYRSLQ